MKQISQAFDENDLSRAYNLANKITMTKIKNPIIKGLTTEDGE